MRNPISKFFPNKPVDVLYDGPINLHKPEILLKSNERKTAEDLIEKLKNAAIYLCIRYIVEL